MAKRKDTWYGYYVQYKDWNDHDNPPFTVCRYPRTVIWEFDNIKDAEQCRDELNELPEEPPTTKYETTEELRARVSKLMTRRRTNNDQ